MANNPTLTAILKDIQDSAEMTPDEALARSSKLMLSIKHERDFHTKTITWSAPHAGMGGGSHTATDAEANDVNVEAALFSISPKRDYSNRSLDGQLVRQTLEGGINDYFFDYVTGEMKVSQSIVNRNIARGAYFSHTGKRGNRGSVSGAVLTLAIIDDAMFWSKGDKVQLSATDGGALLDAGDFVTLLAVNEETGQLTADAVWSNISGTADGDFLYRKGDLNKSYFGLSSYCPAVAPTTGDAVFGAGVDRSVNVTMLAGRRLTVTGQSKETVLIRAMATCQKSPGDVFQDAKIFAALEDVADLAVAKEGARVISTNEKYNIGVSGFMVGTVPVIPDLFCPVGTFFVVGAGALEFHSNKGVDIDTTDGNTMRKQAGDSYTLQSLCDGNFKCPLPQGLARGTWPTG